MCDVDADGKIYVLDAGNDRVAIFEQDGKFLKAWGKPGTGPSELYLGSHGGQALIHIGKDGRVYIYSRLAARMQIFSLDGRFIDVFQLDRFKNLSKFSVNSKGWIYFSRAAHDHDLNTIYLYKPSDKGYNFAKEFGKQPFHRIKKELFNRAPSAAISLTYNHLVHNENDELYQIFERYPLIRKYDQNGKLVWQKFYGDYEGLKLFTGRGAEKLAEVDKPSNIELTNRKDRSNTAPFSTCSDVDIAGQRLLLRLSYRSIILSIDYDGNIKGAYYPDDIFFTNQEKLNKEDVYSSKNIKSYFWFVYSSANSTGIFLDGVNYHLYKSSF